MLNNITRRDIVGDILTLFDYVEELERENERLKKECKVQPRRTKDENKSCIDEFILKKGKAQVFDYVINRWYKVECTYDEETDLYNCTSYVKWTEKKISNERMPKEFSFNMFVGYFKQELMEMYTKEKKEAIKKAKEEN